MAPLTTDSSKGSSEGTAAQGDEGDAKPPKTVKLVEENRAGDDAVYPPQRPSRRGTRDSGAESQVCRGLLLGGGPTLIETALR